MILSTNFNLKSFDKDVIVSGKKKQQVKSHLDDEDRDDNIKLLEDCANYWFSLLDFRDRRKKSRKYLRGDQWHELMTDPDDPTSTITEEEYIENQGKVPLKQNITRQLEKNLVGQFRANPFDSIIIARDREEAKISEMVTIAMKSIKSINKAKELDVRNFEEIVLSGMPIGKTTFRYWDNKNREDVFMENINPNRIFFNTDVSDVRMLDLNLIGEILDVNLGDVIASFAKTKADEEVIRGWYVDQDIDSIVIPEGLSADRIDFTDFYISVDVHKCRVIEVWRKYHEWRLYVHDPLDASYEIVPMAMKDELNKANESRMQMAQENGIEDPESYLMQIEEKYEPYWMVKYLTPTGETLYSGETPYDHEEHPYTIQPYPMLDNEVWGLIEDVIDQQRYINRLITLMDFMMGSAAKGVLLIPDGSIPDDMTPDDVASEWSKFNGVLRLKMKAGVPVPQQIHANMANIGAKDMLALQLKFMQEIFGSSPAIQGQQAASGTPSSLYAQEAQNATLNSKDIMDHFAWYIENRDQKVLKLMLQYYTEERYINIAGTSYSDEAKIFKPDLVKDVDIDLEVTQGVDTPIYRQMIDDLLFKMLESNFVDVDTFLENTSLPFADKVLESIKSKRQQMQEGMAPGAELPPELQGQDQLSPQTQQVFDQLMNKAKNGEQFDNVVNN